MRAIFSLFLIVFRPPGNAGPAKDSGLLRATYSRALADVLTIVGRRTHVLWVAKGDVLTSPKNQVYRNDIEPDMVA